MNARRHHVLIIGVGSIGERHLRCFRATGRADVWIVEINERSAARSPTATASIGRTPTSTPRSRTAPTSP